MLIDEFKEKCVIVNKLAVNDGYGGVETKWIDGAEIECIISVSNSIQAKQAMVDGVKDIYTILTDKEVVLRYGDVVKRLKDGRSFRVTTNGDDEKTPEMSTLNKRKVSAEEWTIPNE